MILEESDHSTFLEVEFLLSEGYLILHKRQYHLVIQKLIFSYHKEGILNVGPQMFTALISGIKGLASFT